jgi:hypothetical protein
MPNEILAEITKYLINGEERRSFLNLALTCKDLRMRCIKICENRVVSKGRHFSIIKYEDEDFEDLHVNNIFFLRKNPLSILPSFHFKEVYVSIQRKSDEDLYQEEVFFDLYANKFTINRFEMETKFIYFRQEKIEEMVIRDFIHESFFLSLKKTGEIKKVLSLKYEMMKTFDLFKRLIQLEVVFENVTELSLNLFQHEALDTDVPSFDLFKLFPKLKFLHISISSKHVTDHFKFPVYQEENFVAIIRRFHIGIEMRDIIDLNFSKEFDKNEVAHFIQQHRNYKFKHLNVRGELKEEVKELLIKLNGEVIIEELIINGAEVPSRFLCFYLSLLKVLESVSK